MARQRRGFSQSVRRRTGWAEGTGGVTPTNFSSSISQFLGQALAVQQDGLTLVRTRGYLRAVLTSAASANDGFAGAFGIGVATTQAVAVGGISSVPTPISEQDWEGWLYWQPLSVQAATSTLSDGCNAVSIQFDYTIDSKAMRKLDDEMTIFAVLECTENGTAIMDVWHDSRMLFKLP